MDDMVITRDRRRGLAGLVLRGGRSCFASSGRVGARLGRMGPAALPSRPYRSYCNLEPEVSEDIEQRSEVGRCLA